MKKYSYLSSSNYIQREKLPLEYQLPTLIGGFHPELRALNNIDNEEQIPMIDFTNAVDQFQDQIIRKTYSENETSKYELHKGRRISQSDYQPLRKKRHRNNSEDYKVKQYKGIEDEYIPNFKEYNLSSYGVDENVILSDNDEEEQQKQKQKQQLHGIQGVRDEIPDSNINNNEILLELHSQVKPIEIEKNDEKFQVNDSIFEIAASPERANDRIILSSLPKEFASFSFTERKNFLNEVLPDSLKNSTDYKNHLSKIIRKNSASASGSSNAMSYLNSFILESPKKIESDTNEFGSIVLEKWKLGRVINKGGFGLIRECFNIDDLNNVKAMKLINVYNSKDFIERFKTEIFMWSLAKNEYIVELLDFKITNNYIFLLMPLFKNGSLFDKVKTWESNSVPLHERLPLILVYMEKSIIPIQYLNSMGIHHGDIKLENYLVEDSTMTPIVCDFGMSNFTNKIKYENTELSKKLFLQSSPKLCKESSTTTLTLYHKLPNELIGSLPYAAPELLQPNPLGLDELTDIWAYGVMIYTLLMLKLPFYHSFEPRLKLMIIEGDWRKKEYEETIEECGENGIIINDIISGCLINDRNKRWNFDKINERLNMLAN